MQVNQNLYALCLGALSPLCAIESNELKKSINSQSAAIDYLHAALTADEKNQAGTLVETNTGFLQTLKRIKTILEKLVEENHQQNMEPLLNRIQELVSKSCLFSKYHIPFDIVILISKNLTLLSVINLSKISKWFAQALPELLVANNANASKVIRRAIKKQKQESLFKLFSGQYSSMRSLCLNGSKDVTIELTMQDIVRLNEHFPNLTKVTARYTSMKQDTHSYIRQEMRNLKTLDLTDAKILKDRESDNGISAYIKLKAVNSPQITANNEELLRPATQNPDLKENNLEQCEKILHDRKQDYETLSVIPLKNLYISNTQTDDQELLRLATQNPDLEEINLHGCQNITDSGLQILDLCKRITKIALTDTQVHDEGLLHFVQRHPNMDYMRLENSTIITAQGLLLVLKHLTKIKSLKLSGSNLDDDGLQAIVKNNSQLEDIDLHGCRNITSTGFRIFGQLKTLKIVNLSTTNIDSQALLLLALQNQQLENIDLSKCNSMTSEGFEALGQLKTLRRAMLDNTKIGDLALESLVKKNNNLNFLDIYWCLQITEQGFKALRYTNSLVEIGLDYTRLQDNELSDLVEQNPNLLKIGLQGCQQLTKKGFNALGKAKSLELVDVFNTNIKGNELYNLAKNLPGLETVRIDLSKVTEQQLIDCGFKKVKIYQCLRNKQDPKNMSPKFMRHYQLQKTSGRIPNILFHFSRVQLD